MSRSLSLDGNCPDSAKISGLIELSSWAFTSAPVATSMLKIKESERNLPLIFFYFSFRNKDLPIASLMDSEYES